MKTIEERAKELVKRIIFTYADVESLENMSKVAESYLTDQKAIDEKYIKLLEEDRNAFIAFCHNIINGKYISVIDAAKEQLSYLENKAMEE